MEKDAFGIELREIDELEKKPKIVKKKESYNKKYVIFQIVIIIIFILAFAFTFNYDINKHAIKKSLIIFDFDKTITETDVFEDQRFLFDSKEEQEDLLKRFTTRENWTSLMQSVYERFYSLNISIDNINHMIDQSNITRGMLDFFEFLKKNKDKFIIAIMSAGHYYQIIRVLDRINMTNLFDEIIAIPSYIKDNKVCVYQNYDHNCDICNACQCKTLEYNKLTDKYKKSKNIIFTHTFYVCDGLNDFCLARNLHEYDTLIVRKGYGLHDALYEKGKIEKLKCKVYSWDNGLDIVNYFYQNKSES